MVPFSQTSGEWTEENDNGNNLWVASITLTASRRASAPLSRLRYGKMTNKTALYRLPRSRTAAFA